MKRFLYTFSILLFIVLAVGAQNYQIKGTVIKQDNT